MQAQAKDLINVYQQRVEGITHTLEKNWGELRGKKIYAHSIRETFKDMRIELEDEARMNFFADGPGEDE